MRCVFLYHTPLSVVSTTHCSLLTITAFPFEHRAPLITS
nr:MAG TPA: hypothetical protein [Caudoviricetes sp.]